MFYPTRGSPVAKFLGLLSRHDRLGVSAGGVGWEGPVVIACRGGGTLNPKP